MRRPRTSARARLLTITLILGLLLSGAPALEMLIAGTAPSTAGPQAPVSAAAKNEREGAGKQGREGKRERKSGNKSNKNKKQNKNKANKKKGDKKKKRKGDRQVAPALDARQIAAENEEATVNLESCDTLETVKVDGVDYCTHGEDPVSFGRTGGATTANAAEARAGSTTAQALCIDDGISGPRIQMVYVHANNAPDRITNLLPTFRRLASEMDMILDQSAAKTGGSLRIRFVTDSGCQVAVSSEAVQAANINSFGGVISELKDRGYSAMNRKYLLMVDTNAFCGVGSFQQDDKPDATVHDGTGYARVDIACWDAGTMLHELGHTLGAVQYSAPHTSRGAHCIDEWDVMCYSDEPYHPKMQYLCDEGSQDFRLDCNNDDYFAANPEPGSYLANHWNMANSIYFADGNGQTCVDEAKEPDDAYWYAFWEVPMPETEVGTVEDHAFCTQPGDADWLLFNGEAGVTYQVTTSNLGTGVDTQLVVYRGFKEQGWGGMDRLGQNDDRTSSDVASQITFTAPATSTYLIGVSDANSHAGYDATYTISLQAVPTTGASALEISRARVRSKGKLTASMTGIASGATVNFTLERGQSTRPIGSATADDAGVASALVSVPKGSAPGKYRVEGVASDGSSATADLRVAKDGGHKNKGGKHQRNKKPKKHRNRR
ncbi:MAG: PPC domain-containing protein [Thermomicrobiales bacterium]